MNAHDHDEIRAALANHIGELAGHAYVRAAARKPLRHWSYDELIELHSELHLAGGELVSGYPIGVS